jgi:tetratricopeptide (TPR) repeat protein
MRRVSILFIFVLATGASAQTALPPTSTVRYTEDYSFLRDPAAMEVAKRDPFSLAMIKFIPLSDAAHLTLGGELRTRKETALSKPPRVASGPRGESSNDRSGHNASRKKLPRSSKQRAGTAHENTPCQCSTNRRRRASHATFSLHVLACFGRPTDDRLVSAAVLHVGSAAERYACTPHRVTPPLPADKLLSTMGLSTAKRVVLYAAVVAGAGLLACPTMTAAAVGAAGIAAAGNLAGNALATDIHSLVSGNQLTSLSNHHLQELVGRALAVCIECYQNDNFPPKDASIVERWIPLLRRNDSELSALAKAARKHWREIDLAPQHAALSDTEIHESFVDHDRSKPHEVISADEWDSLIESLCEEASDKDKKSLWIDPVRRRVLSKYIAEKFATAVRELVKADLDPSVGTGGRVFIALHLDLMNALYAATRRVEAKTDDVLKKLETLEKHNADLSKLVVDHLTDEQKAHKDIFDLVDANRREHETTRTLIADGFATLNKKVDDNTDALARIEALVRAQLQQNPGVAATLSPDDQRIIDEYKRSTDERKQLNASVLQPDDQTDALLAAAKEKHLAEAFDLAMLEGKRWYFSSPIPQYDAAIPHFERAVKLRPSDLTARNNAAVAHSQARLGDIAAHQHRAIELYEGTLKLTPPGSVDWAMTQNNLGNALTNMPTGDRGKNLAKAVAAYEAALTVYTRSAHPVDWATTQNNLGIALADMPTGDRGENLTKAVAAFDAALTVRTRSAHPVEWAGTQNNLGNAWLNMPTGDRTDEKAGNLAKAVAAYEAALTVYTSSAHPVEWAATQNNLGNAWQSMPTGDRTDEKAGNLAKAVAAYEAALTVYTRSAHPVDWAMTQYNLGIALVKLAELPGQDACGLLRRAIAASKGALTVYTADAFPREHARTTNHLAIMRRMYEAAGCGDGDAGDVPFDDIPPAD